MNSEEAVDQLVSIIMPAYNAKHHISEAIQSVLKQDYEFYELIIVNDGSEDNTAEIVNNYAINDKRIFLHNLKKNSGVAKARNYGINIAKGEFIAFLDSDDSWHPNKLTKQIRYMIENKAKVSCTNYRRISDSNKNTTIICPSNITYEKLLTSNFIANSSAIYNAKILGKYYQESIGHEDYLMWLEILKDTKAITVPEVLMDYTENKNGISSNIVKGAIWHWKILKKQKEINLIQKMLYMITYTYYAFMKRLKIKV